MPATYFARSELENCSFRNTDLTRSTMCWNDFIEVDFRDAILVECDLRASSFDGCDFTGADLRGALASRDAEIDLSDAQRAVISWSDDEPNGG